MNIADFQLSSRDGILIVTLEGEIDVSNADVLGTALSETMANEVLGMILDLTTVDYLDSAGIHLLYRLRERLQTRGQTLNMVVPSSSPAADALRLAGVTGSIDVAETVDGAWAIIRPEPASPGQAGHADRCATRTRPPAPGP